MRGGGEDEEKKKKKKNKKKKKKKKANSSYAIVVQDSYIKVVPVRKLHLNRTYHMPNANLDLAICKKKKYCAVLQRMRY